MPQLSKLRSTTALFRFLFCFFACGLTIGCSHVAHYVPNAIGPLPAGSFRLGWLADLNLENDSITEIDVRSDLIFILTASKHVAALDRQTGTIQFIALVNSPSRLLPPVVLADKVVFPTAISLEIFDRKGHFIRSLPLSAPLRSGAAGIGDNIYFGSDDPGGGRVNSVDLSRSFATVRWQLLTPGGAIVSVPLIYDGNLYVGTESGDVYAVNQDRAPIWDIENGIFKTYGPIVADLKADAPSVKLDQAGLYVASKDSTLYCIDPRSGKLKWQFFAGEPLVDAPVPTSDMVYQYIRGQGIAAIDKNSTAYNRPAKWIYAPAEQFLSEDDQYAYLMEPRPDPRHRSRIDHLIVAVDKQTGQKAFKSEHSDFSVFGINPFDSTIYVAYPAGQFLAVQPVTKPGQLGELVMAPITPKSVALAN